ncbi:hypothetical protein HK405_004988, partial [Cladochytrium tenue]
MESAIDDDGVGNIPDAVDDGARENDSSPPATDGVEVVAPEGEADEEAHADAYDGDFETDEPSNRAVRADDAGEVGGAERPEDDAIIGGDAANDVDGQLTAREYGSVSVVPGPEDEASKDVADAEERHEDAPLVQDYSDMNAANELLIEAAVDGDAEANAEVTEGIEASSTVTDTANEVPIEAAVEQDADADAEATGEIETTTAAKADEDDGGIGLPVGETAPEVEDGATDDNGLASVVSASKPADIVSAVDGDSAPAEVAHVEDVGSTDNKVFGEDGERATSNDDDKETISAKADEPASAGRRRGPQYGSRSALAGPAARTAGVTAAPRRATSAGGVRADTNTTTGGVETAQNGRAGDVAGTVPAGAASSTAKGDSGSRPESRGSARPSRSPHDRLASSGPAGTTAVEPSASEGVAALDPSQGSREPAHSGGSGAERWLKNGTGVRRADGTEPSMGATRAEGDAAKTTATLVPKSRGERHPKNEKSGSGNEPDAADLAALVSTLRRQVVALRCELGLPATASFDEDGEDSGVGGGGDPDRRLRVLLDRQKKGYQELVGRLRREVRRLKFQRNSLADPLVELQYFPYLPRTSTAPPAAKGQRAVGGGGGCGSTAAGRATDTFALNPPPPTGRHADNGARWWWGSGAALEAGGGGGGRDAGIIGAGGVVERHASTAPAGVVHRGRASWDERVPDGAEAVRVRSKEKMPGATDGAAGATGETAVKVGDRAWVVVNDERCLGMVKYVGTFDARPDTGLWCGIKLDRPVGRHDGVVRGKRYFSCDENHGVFVRVGRIERVAGTVRVPPPLPRRAMMRETACE